MRELRRGPHITWFHESYLHDLCLAAPRSAKNRSGG